MKRTRSLRPLSLLLALLLLVLTGAPALALEGTVTLTFRMEGAGDKTLTVPLGTTPNPADIPPIPEKPGLFGHWYDAAGQQTDPAAAPATQDAVFTARWSRTVADLLLTDQHNAYVEGFPAGTFRPNANMTRAEAAQMLYSLLRNKNVTRKSFTDVKANQWYTVAVETLAGLGIVSGYGNGKFGPGDPVTRAQFVTMAAAFESERTDTPASFSDVSASHWANGAIALGAAKGWIEGYGNGKFGPDDKVTRAQAVTIINKMLGRQATDALKALPDAKNFYDVFPDQWYYTQVLEAATNHEYDTAGGSEVWTEYTHDTKTAASGWVSDGVSRYYLDGKTRKFLRGTQTIDGNTYRMDDATGALFEGFVMIDGYRRYYHQGVLADDISGLGVVHGPYAIKVYKSSNYLIIYARDSAGKYNTPVRAMRVSCGNPTPTGVFYTPQRFRWLEMVGSTWAQWCTQIKGSYLFHSVPNYTHSNTDLEVGEYNLLGSTRSLGCIRLNCRDAKWIYDNCALGTQVTITTSEKSGPLAKPDGLTVPSWHTWDPTDPTAAYLCKQRGCH